MFRKSRLAILIVIILTLFLGLTGCMGGMSFDFGKLLENRVIQIMLGILVLWIVFKMNANKS
jgi:hypothetical protein